MNYVRSFYTFKDPRILCVIFISALAHTLLNAMDSRVRTDNTQNNALSSAASSSSGSSASSAVTPPKSTLTKTTSQLAKGAAALSAWRPRLPKQSTTKRTSLKVSSPSASSSSATISRSSADDASSSSTDSAQSATSAASITITSANTPGDDQRDSNDSSDNSSASASPASSGMIPSPRELAAPPRPPVLPSSPPIVPPVVKAPPAPGPVAITGVLPILSPVGRRVADLIQNYMDHSQDENAHLGRFYPTIQRLNDLKQEITSLNSSDRAILAEVVFFNNWEILQRILPLTKWSLPDTIVDASGVFAITKSPFTTKMVNMSDRDKIDSLDIGCGEKAVLSTNGERAIIIDGGLVTYWYLIDPFYLRHAAYANARHQGYSLGRMASPITCMTLSANGEKGLTGHANRECRYWDFRDLQNITSSVIFTHGLRASQVILSADGNCALTCGNGHAYYHAQLTTARTSTRLNHSSVTHAAMTPDGHYCLTASDQRTVQYWNCNDLSMSKDLFSGLITHDIADLVLSADAKKVVIAFGKVAQLADLTDPENVISCPLKHDSYIKKLCISSDGKYCLVHHSNNGEFCWGTNKLRALDSGTLWNISRPQTAYNPRTGNHNTPNVLIDSSVWSFSYVGLDARGHALIDSYVYPLVQSNTFSLWHMALICLRKRWDFLSAERQYYGNELRNINDERLRDALKRRIGVFTSF